MEKCLSCRLTLFTPSYVFTRLALRAHWLAYAYKLLPSSGVKKGFQVGHTKRHQFLIVNIDHG